MSDVRIWITAVSTPEPDLDTLKRFKRCHIDAIELSVRPPACDAIDWPALRRNADEAGVELWSFHLPFSNEINIALPDEADRQAAVAYQRTMIDRACAVDIRRFVIHPSAEPIPDEDRPLWMASALRSLAELAEYCARYDAVLCVEDLPRTCLGHTADEMLTLLSADERLRVCFDVNHLLTVYGTTHREFVDKLGDKIVTVHMSDYDFLDERHYFPGNGLIDWKPLIESLEQIGYSGPFLYEGGFKPSNWNPAVPYASYEDAHQRHLQIKEFRGNQPC